MNRPRGVLAFFPEIVAPCKGGKGSRRSGFPAGQETEKDGEGRPSCPLHRRSQGSHGLRDPTKEDLRHSWREMQRRVWRSALRRWEATWRLEKG
ncbi:hypothetical protein E2320_013950 [Naja naja]|nr:hypothetical protein E2320_013950 [Naja naja]